MPVSNPWIKNGQARDNVCNNGVWFNTAVFFNPNDLITAPMGEGRSKAFVFGKTSRPLGSVRRDDYVNLDFSLFKQFRVTEKLGFEFRAEALNALNDVVFGTATTNVNSPQFGWVVTQLNLPQRIQLAGRITF